MTSAHSRHHVFTRMRLAVFVSGFALLGLAGSPVLGQSPDQNKKMNRPGTSAEMDMTRPAPILVIYKEDVKAGRVASHDDLEANFARTYAKMPGARHYLAMNSMSGPNEAWFMQPYSSLADVEKEYQANNHAPASVKTELRRIGSGELDNLTNQMAIATVYRDDLSYNVNINDLPKCRYVEVITFRIRPGHENEFVDATNLVKSAYQKANMPVQWATYQVFAGGPADTYYVFRAMDSLTKADPTNREMMQTFHQALGEEGHKRLMQLSADAIMMHEANFFAFNPKTSFAPPEFAAADSFWSQPALMAQVGTSGKSVKTRAAKKMKKH